MFNNHKAPTEASIIHTLPKKKNCTSQHSLFLQKQKNIEFLKLNKVINA